ncbi:MAG: hypothetical protein CMN30_33485 [Sandaracinus sp.]|nr:hypothetical protein [Sandaracinus sp.]|tara:strand:+ start:1912 stop:2835 length:924 start_codon:yes stop_codon:yes gene_type:complete
MHRFIWLTLPVLLLACGDDDGGTLCSPGTSEACAGSGGCAGERVCLPGGDEFGACQCDDLDGGLTDSGVERPDAGDPSDAGAGGDAGALDAGTPDDCEPVSQTGCAAGEKCTYVYEVGDMTRGRTTCAPEGSIDVGESCAFAAMSGGEVDDCVPGAVCEAGVCTPICDALASGGCDDGAVCLDLVTPLRDREDVGVCTPMCDPFAPDCGPFECRYFDGAFFCRAPEADPRGAGEECGIGEACEPHLVCAASAGPALGVCSYVCNLDGDGNSCADLAGAAAGLTCVPLEAEPANAGVCLDCPDDPSCP